MAIPACVDPNACGTAVSFNTSGIKVDVVPNNVGCGVDLSCSTSGLTATARLLANGGLECDGSRRLYVDRRGSTAAEDPGGCYESVRIDPSGGIFVNPTVVRTYEVLQVPETDSKQIPAENITTGEWTFDPLTNDTDCDELWVGFAQVRLNVTGDGPFPENVVCSGAFRLWFTTPPGLTIIDDTSMNIMASYYATDSGHDEERVWGFIPFRFAVSAGATVTPRATFTTRTRHNVAGPKVALDNDVLVRNVRLTRMFL